MSNTGGLLAVRSLHALRVVRVIARCWFLAFDSSSVLRGGDVLHRRSAIAVAHRSDQELAQVARVALIDIGRRFVVLRPPALGV